MHLTVNRITRMWLNLRPQKITKYTHVYTGTVSQAWSHFSILLVPASVKVLIQWIILYLFQDMKGKLMCRTQQLGLQHRLDSVQGQA